MTKLIYQSEHVQVEYNPEYSLLTISSNIDQGTSLPSEKALRREVLRIQETIDAFRPIYMLIDKNEFYYSLSLTQLDWLHEQIVCRAIGYGLQKFAVIMSDDIYAQIALEQILKCGDTEHYMNYFSYRAEAYSWLVSEARTPILA